MGTRWEVRLCGHQIEINWDALDVSMEWRLGGVFPLMITAVASDGWLVARKKRCGGGEVGGCVVHGQMQGLVSAACTSKRAGPMALSFS